MGQEVRNEHLPSGVYLVRIVVQGETYTLKVVIR
ncbi:T9SS type A sorting domain-containing protein [Klebsiella pneumoniae]